MVPFQHETTFCGPACWVMTLMALSLFVPRLIVNLLWSKKGLIKMHISTHNHFIQHQKRYSPEAYPTHHTLCKRLKSRLRAMVGGGSSQGLKRAACLEKAGRCASEV